MADALPSYEQAAAVVAQWAAAFAEPGKAERLPLDAAAGRILAQELRADRDLPPFVRSTRDGFAVRAADASLPGWLTVAGSTRAGQAPAAPLGPGAAWEIMTGAPVPAGADAVVMVEHVEREGDRMRLAPGRGVKAGENIVPVGAEAAANAVLVAPGVRLGPAQIAAAAMCGYAEADVYPRPRVAIVTTGDELVAVHQQPGPGQIRNSNAPMLAALAAQAGGDPWVLPPVPDQAAAIEAAIAQALGADLLLISGGVSAGRFDLVEPALAAKGAAFHFTGVRIQPGKPLVFGELPRPGQAPLPFFGLPGNPISSAATFLLFGAQVLAALAGSAHTAPRFAAARLARPMPGKGQLTRFVPACVTPGAQGDIAPEVAGVFWQGSGDLAAFARANCFVQVPEGTETLPAGSWVRILPF